MASRVGGHGDFGHDSYSAGPLNFPSRHNKSEGPFIFQSKFVADANARNARSEDELLDGANHVLEKLVEKGLAAEEAERRRFYDVIDRLRATNDPNEKQKLGDELGRMVFGE